jgi:hypothetical protein
MVRPSVAHVFVVGSAAEARLDRREPGRDATAAGVDKPYRGAVAKIALRGTGVSGATLATTPVDSVAGAGVEGDVSAVYCASAASQQVADA